MFGASDHLSCISQASFGESAVIYISHFWKEHGYGSVTFRKVNRASGYQLENLEQLADENGLTHYAEGFRV